MYGYVSPAAGAERDPIAGLRETLLITRPAADFGLLRRAYEVAAECHLGQFRKSGDPYISHPVMVATILAGLSADDQTLCAAILHDTVEDTPLTLSALRTEFGVAIAALVAEQMTLDRIKGQPRHVAAAALAAIKAADNRAAVLKMADRLHTMRTLAFATLLRNRPVRPPAQRTIVALDIESSTSRPDPVKAELRIMLYELFDAALRGAGIYPDQRDPFIDRGDGLLALLHPVPQEPATWVLSRAVPYLGRLLATYNAGAGSQRQLRVRVVVHAGEVNDDGRGWFGAALDTACRLLDAPAAKKALAAAPGTLLMVVSEEVCRSGGVALDPGARQISVDVGGERRFGWASVPG